MVVDALAETYDFVMLALPVPDRAEPVLEAADRADIALLLHDRGQPAAEIEAARADLAAAGAPEILAIEIPVRSSDERQARSAA